MNFGQWRWTPVAIAVLAFTLVVGGGFALTHASDDDGNASATTTVATNGDIGIVGVDDDPAAETVPDTVPDTTAVAGNAVATKTPIGHTLTKGAQGDDVKMVQQRLADLKFDPGPIDGVYGTYTIQAVWAFETLVLNTARKDMTGKVTPEMWDRMQDDVLVAPRRTNLTSTHVEIYLPEQALVVFKDNVPALVAHISSGQLEVPDQYTKGAEWCSNVTIDVGELGNENGTEPITKGVCGNAETPGGTYRFFRKVEGRRESRLGGMYDPVYFNNGIAVHGAENVPNHPDSHGCIRINRRLGPIFQKLITNLGKNSGDQVYVWNGVKDPEYYGARSGWFDWNDPNSTTTTSTSTTSTTAPATTVPPPVTTVPPATTTTKPVATTTTTTTLAPTTTTLAPTTAPPAATEPPATPAPTP